MTRADLHRQILEKRSFLCVGLDPDPERLPRPLRQHPDPIFAFNQAIIEATRDLCVAYKPNLAFYESLGSYGLDLLERTLAIIPDGHFTIADAKRGDIGNTSRRYAQAFFETLSFDAVTVAPYMGEDSVRPFLEFPGKWVILLALTSNRGSQDFQFSLLKEGEPLYARVLRRAMNWGTPEQLMFVVGATHPTRLAEVRAIAPDHFLLVPGVGAQGGDLQAVATHGMNDLTGLLVNSSRGILYAGDGEDFAERARQAAVRLQRDMAARLDAFTAE